MGKFFLTLDLDCGIFMLKISAQARLSMPSRMKWKLTIFSLGMDVMRLNIIHLNLSNPL